MSKTQPKKMDFTEVQKPASVKRRPASVKWSPASFSEALGVENTRNIQKHTDFSEAPLASLKPGRADFTEVENRTSVKPGFGFRKLFPDPLSKNLPGDP